MQVTLDLTYNEMDSVLSVLGSTITAHLDISQKHKWSQTTIDCLKAVETKLEDVFEKCDPDED